MHAVDPESIVHAIRSALGENVPMPVALHEPAFRGNESRYVQECIDTGWVSSVGKFVDQFEQQLAEYTGAKRAVAVVNGTAALHMALHLVGAGGADEVLVPTLTFIATANAVSYCGAALHLVDSEATTLGVDVEKLSGYLEQKAIIKNGECFNRDTGRRIRAIVPMHVFGHPVDLDHLAEVCTRFHIELIEDAAESLGSRFKGRHTGTFGRLGALSFNGNKIITTGGGGAILTDDEALGRRAKHLTTTARVPHKWSFIHDEVGYNYRLPNLNAALGCAQIEQLDGFLKSKRALADRYRRVFATVPGVSFFSEMTWAQSNYWLNAILLDEPDLALREAILRITNESGFMTRPVWTLMHRLPMFANAQRMDLSCAEALERRIINLPSSATL